MVTYPNLMGLGTSILTELNAKEEDLGEILFALNKVTNEFRQQEKWEAATSCSNIVLGLSRDKELESFHSLNVSYAYGVALMYRGVLDLSRDALESAADCFHRSGEEFRIGGKRRCEGVAWRALGEVMRRCNEWQGAFKALQQALVAFDSASRVEAVGQLRNLTINRLRAMEEELRATFSDREASKLAFTPDHAPSLIRVPVVAEVCAGEGLLAGENIIEYLYLDKEIVGSAGFALKVHGNSLEKGGILSDDYALVSSQPVVRNGDLAVAIIPRVYGDSEGVLKRYYKWYGLHILWPESDEHGPQILVPMGSAPPALESLRIRYEKLGIEFQIIEVEDGSETIVGKVVGILRTKIPPTPLSKLETEGENGRSDQ